MQSVTGGARASDQGAGASERSSSRWPTPDPDARYVVVLGGSATLGKAVAQPFPALVAAATGLTVLNLGVSNGGPDAYLSDRGVLHLISRAEAAVVQLTGAETLSNPYYSVHSRRNDRFLAATPELQALYPEVDVTEIHFARHLLRVLARTDAERFALVVDALKATWIARMQSLLVHLPLRRRLLWLSDAPPPDRADGFGAAPLFVDKGMLDRLRPLGGEVIVALPSPAARAADMAAEPKAEASGLPGPAAHREIAGTLAPILAAQARLPLLLLRHAKTAL
jgi:Domain of unknown function (DUF6473)